MFWGEHRGRRRGVVWPATSNFFAIGGKSPVDADKPPNLGPEPANGRYVVIFDVAGATEASSDATA